MFFINDGKKSPYTYLGLFSGAGGLDLGFEKAGFEHTQSSDILEVAVNTLRRNRPDWDVLQCDVCEYTPNFKSGLDVLLAGFPCQGFSLGGKRDAADKRNALYKQVVRIAEIMQPRVIVMENVLNLRTMRHPVTGKPFAEELSAIGYTTRFEFFKVCHYGVPQTRRRFIFIAYRDSRLSVFRYPTPGKITPIRDFVYELGQKDDIVLPNHNPVWGFKSFAHIETHEPYKNDELAIPVRFSRTASEGNPVRNFDSPFPAIDTATVWGWAKGNVRAYRIEKDRSDSLYVRDPASQARLWRISASRLRSFTAREYARLQTFPDDWAFTGDNKRDIHLQIGNAVPVMFAKCVAMAVREALEYVDGVRSKLSATYQPSLFDCV